MLSTRVLRLLQIAPILASQVIYALPYHCRYGEPCWPAASIWQQFNASIDGQLVAVLPPAAPCHAPNYNDAACSTARSNWVNSFWRADQPGAYETPYWERGLNGTCFIGTPVDQPCDQGLVPVLAASANNADHVQKSVQFAKKHRLSVVVKNTGHDYLGRSTGAGSFMIWTHKLKGIEFSDAFTPSNAPRRYSAKPAVTVHAGEQWIDVYKAAHDKGVVVVGGAARSVGAAGGWALGGGHSPLGHKYGMGVDNIVQITLVTPDGKYRIANEYANKELFWGLRGGGGSAWGVILTVTYKTHPALNNVLAGLFLFNASTPEHAFNFTTTAFAALPSVVDKGFSGYLFLFGTSFGFAVLQPDSKADPNNTRDFTLANNDLAPLLNYSTTHPGSGEVAILWTKHTSYWDWFNNTIGDVSIGENTWIGGRLVTRDAFINRPDQLADLFRLGGSINVVAGGAVSKVDPDSVALNPAWRNGALASANVGYGAWPDSANATEILWRQQQTTALSERLGDIIGPGSGAYFNEADPNEPNWKEVFWGKSHYSRLLRLKRSIDPQNLFTCNRCVGSDL
ncbi:hypothetical protein FRC03_001424 [Tulasnella sp. 419]|nr:hypothetical protein FRC03_001424 [Tulasnella sp. 419]